MPGATIRFADGSDPAAAAALARSSDVAIVFGTQWAGESFDVPLQLDGNGDALISAVAAVQPKTVVVLETGGPVLTPWAGHAAAVLEAWYPGTSGGAAIADLLTGRADPSGHLPATFPASLDQLPHPAPPHPRDTTYTEGATVGYKWYDAKGLKPAFAFGHGLSYTTFRFSGLKAARAGMGASASFTVANTGKVAGAAVPQVYVSPASGGWEAPKRLGGFTKVMLQPGQSQTVSVTIDPRLFATWDQAGHQWRIAGGSYRLMLARSAGESGETTTLTLPAQTIPAGWHPEDARKQ
jgi:beta-glucosidase